MTIMAPAVPGAGQVMEGAAGPAGGAGPSLAGGFHDAVAEASDPFGSVTRDIQLQVPPVLPRAQPPSWWAEPAVLLVAGLVMIATVAAVRSRRRRGWGRLAVRGGTAPRLWR